MMINKRLINLCIESKKYIVLTVLSNLIAVICNIITIIFIGQFLNKIYSGQTLDVSSKGIVLAFKEFNVFENISLFSLIFIIIGLLCIRFISNILYARFSNLASEKARVTLRENIYKKLLKIGTGYSSKYSTSSVVQVMVEGVEQLEVYFGKYLPQLFYSLIVPITLFIFMCFISFKAALVFILCVPLIPLSIIGVMKIAKRILKDYWKSYSDLGGTFLENLQGLTTLKVFNIDENRQEKMNNEAEGFRKMTMKVLSMQLNSITIMDLVAFGGAAAGTIVALIQFKNGHLEAGSLIIIILLSSEFFIPLRLLGSFFHIAMNGMAASDKMFSILDFNKVEKCITEKINKDEGVSVKLNNINFSYDGERNVINNVRMNVTKGGVVAIVGESGSGKSTVASLILNENSVDSGELLLNSKNIENISNEDIYENIALVSTNSYIFSGTILDNLIMGCKNVSSKEIEKALKTARLYDFVKELKSGLNTKVSEGGNSLSGGQKQRLALARAILANREMIIFDEATSNIDIESEEGIWDAIYELSSSKTILVISHRLANVKNAKNIYVMKNGCVVESGTHNLLIESNGYYKNMYEKQEELEKLREVC